MSTTATQPEVIATIPWTPEPARTPLQNAEWCIEKAMRTASESPDATWGWLRDALTWLRQEQSSRLAAMTVPVRHTA